MRTKFIAHKNTRFVINEGIKQLELRESNGKFLASICCKDCVKQLKKAIKQFEKMV